MPAPYLSRANRSKLTAITAGSHFTGTFVINAFGRKEKFLFALLRDLTKLEAVESHINATNSGG
jgi:hypothetical protein